MVISRVPAGESVAHPPSACPRCGHAIRFRHNVPVLGWLVLGGRCYDCHEPISVRYPLIEALTGAVFGALAAWLGVTWDLGLALIVAFFTIVLSAIDLEVRRLPDAVVVPFSAMVAVYLVVWTGVDGDWSRLLHALLGAAILGAFYFGAWFIYPRGMGFGDVKARACARRGAGLVRVGGTHRGWLRGLCLGRARGRHGDGHHPQGAQVAIPFGPWMFAGVWTGLLCGTAISESYLRLAGL
ncbi:prepilin peptidase [Demequina litorisediminis]|uniref:prepilin peptidase n=1 Tax=Demequina litorisediminis TaxID=1849022 RepID=UPI0024E1183B|nr:A24 family peptidase [Demequina litorisediminis]